MSDLSSQCKHAIEEKENEIGESCVFCELTDNFENVTLGNCFGNCESQSPVEKLKSGYHWECKYCDGTYSVQSPYEEKGFMVCGSCGAEWEDCKIQVKNEQISW